MKINKKLLVLTSVFLFIALIIGSTPLMANEEMNIALVLPGEIDDVSWNQAMYESMKEIEEKMDNVSVTYLEEVYTVPEIEPALMDLANEGYDLIFGHGFQFMEPIITVAEQFPDTHFALGTGYMTRSNTAVYDVSLQDGGYVMGVIAGMLTETDIIGVVGGVDVVEIFRGHEAFKYAAKKYNPDVEIQEVYTGDWTDASAAREAASSIYDSGADIIWTSGDGVGMGVIRAASDHDELVLGNVFDTNVLAPDNVVTSVVYNWTPIIENIINDIRDGTFDEEEDKFYWATAANRAISIAPYYNFEDKLPQEVKDEVKKVYEGLATGDIEIPEFEQE